MANASHLTANTLTNDYRGVFGIQFPDIDSLFDRGTRNKQLPFFSIDKVAWNFKISYRFIAIMFIKETQGPCAVVLTWIALTHAGGYSSLVSDFPRLG